MTAPAPARPAPPATEVPDRVEERLRAVLGRVKGKLAVLAGSKEPAPKLDPKATRQAIRVFGECLSDTRTIRMAETVRLNGARAKINGAAEPEERSDDDTSGAARASHRAERSGAS